MARIAGDQGGKAVAPPVTRQSSQSDLPTAADRAAQRERVEAQRARIVAAAARAEEQHRKAVADRLARRLNVTEGLDVGGKPIPKPTPPAGPTPEQEREWARARAMQMLDEGVKRGLNLMAGDGVLPFGMSKTGYTPGAYTVDPNSFLRQMRELRADQLARGDSAFDRDRLDRLDERFGLYVKGVDDDLNAFLERAAALEARAARGDKGAAEQLLEMAQGSEYQELLEKYNALYGSAPGAGGVFDGYYNARQGVATAHEQFWLSRLATEIFGVPTDWQDLQTRYPGLSSQEIEKRLTDSYNNRLAVEYQRQNMARKAAKVEFADPRGSGASPEVRKAVLDAANALGYGPDSRDPDKADFTAGESVHEIDLSDPAVTTRIIERAMADWDAAHPASYLPPTSQGRVVAQPQLQPTYVSDRAAFRDGLYRYLQGRVAPGRLESIFETIVQSPPVTAAMDVLTVGVGTAGAGFRGLAAQGGNEWSGVGFNLNAMGQADWEEVNRHLPASVRNKFGTGSSSRRDVLAGASSVEVRDWDQKAFDAWRLTPEGAAWWKAWVDDHPSYGPALYSTDPNLRRGPAGVLNYFPGADLTDEERRQRVAESGAQLGSQWDAAMEKSGGGDLLGGWWDAVKAVSSWGSNPYAPEAGFSNLTYQGVFDPMNNVAPTTYVRALQLARARSAGTGVRSIGKDYLGLLAHYRFGTAKPHHLEDPIRDYMLQRPIAKILGKKTVNVAELTPDDFRRIEESIFTRHADDPNVAGIRADLANMFRGTPMDPVQIQAAAEAAFDELMLLKGAKTIRHGEFVGLRDRLRTAVDDAANKKAAAAAEDAARVADERAAAAAAAARERRLAAERRRGRYERADDFEDAPKTDADIKPGSYKRPGDFRAPVAHRAVGDRLVRYYNKGLERVDGFRLTVHAPTGQAEDVIAVAEDLARSNRIGLRWARSPGALRGKPVVELFGGDQATMLSVGRKLDELLDEYRLGSKPPADSSLARHGKVEYRFRSSDSALERRSLAGERVGPEDPFERYARRERLIERVDAKVDAMGDGLADLQNRLEAALVKARAGGSAAEAGKITAELQRAVRRHDAYKRLRERAMVEQRAALGDGRPSRGASPEEKARLDYLASELSRDEKFLRVEHHNLARRLARATTALERKRLQQLMRDIDDAMAGIEIARLDQLGAAHMANIVSTRYLDQAVQYVRPAAIAPTAASGDALRVVRGGELHARLYGRTVTPDDDWAGQLGNKRLRDAVDAAESTPTILPASLSKALDKKVLAIVEPLPFWSQTEALLVLSRTVPAAKAVFEARMKKIAAAINVPSGAKPLEGEDLLAALLSARRVEAVDFDAFRDLDELVSKAVRDVRGHASAGQFRGVVPDWMDKHIDEIDPEADVLPSPFVRTDHDDAILLAKIRVLSRRGIDVRGYDELRSVFAPALVREKRWTAIHAEATSRAAADGRPLLDHMKEVRAEWVRFEARLQLRKFVLLSGAGGRPADYWDSFVRAQEEAQLKVVDPRPITAFQERSMRKAIVHSLGLRTFDDTAQLKAALRGLPAVPDEPGMRLAEIGEFPGIPAHVPVWVSDRPLRLEGREVDAYFRRNHGLVLGPHKQYPGHQAVNANHEYGHALVDYSRREGLAVVDDLARIAGANIDGLDKVFGLRARGYEVRELVNEAVAEAYATWRKTEHLKAMGATADELTSSYTWDWLLKNVPPEQAKALDDMVEHFRKLEPPSPEYFGLNLDVAPPFTNAAAAREWLVENGYWSPRLGDDVLTERRVWSLDDEQDFWMGRYGSLPAWADEALFDGTAVLHQRFTYEEAMRSVGVMNRRIESATATHVVTDAKRAVAYGDEASGIKPARSALDRRDWFIGRYGRRVSSDGKNLTDGVPWLMDPESPQFLNYYERYGATIPNRTLVTPKQAEAFGRAVRAAVAKRIERMKAAGELEDGAVIIPQEMVRMSLDVTDELLDDPVWRSFFERSPAGARGLAYVGMVQRLNVITQPAFVVMNVLETLPVVGPKRWFLELAESGLPGTVRADVRAAVPDLASLGLGPQTMLWDVTGRTSWERLRQSDSIFEATGVLDVLGRTGTAARHTVGAALEAPFALSAVAENNLKLGFARRLFQDRFDHYVATGLAKENAAVLARLETATRVRQLFPTLEGAPLWLHALNQIIPFLSYNWNTNILYAGALLSHPQFLRYFNILGAEWEKANRAAWEEDHPGLPFPSNKQAGEFVFEIGGEKFTIDFGKFSDVTRGWQTVPFLLSGGERPVSEIIQRFIRVPHPWQAAVLAWAFGGKEPWSDDPATLGSWIWPVDVMELLDGLMDDGTLSLADLVRLASKVAFFAEPKPLDIDQSLNAAYWGLPEGAARERFLALHPELLDYWKSTVDRPSLVIGGTPDVSWFDVHTDEEAAALKEAQAGMDRLREYYDGELDDLLRAGVLPNDPRYRAIEAERRNALMQYRLDHPEMISISAFYMTPADWAEHQDELLTDREVDEFFAMKPPARESYATEGAYLGALSDFYDGRELWLEAHPRVQEVLRSARTSLEQAIQAHQDHMFDLREEIAARNVQIARAEAVGDDDLAAALRYVNELTYLEIDRPSAVEYNPPPIEFEHSEPGNRDYLKNQVPFVAVLPGAKDARYAKATQAEKQEMLVDHWYGESMREIWRGAELAENPGAAFVEALRERPDLMREYFRRNPGKEAEYARNDRYFGLIDKAAKSGNWNHFFVELANDPEMARRWAYGPQGETMKVMSSTNDALERALAQVRKSGRADAIWELVENNASFRELYFAGQPEREKKWKENQRYQDAMGDLVRRSKRSGDWSIFWDELESNKWLREKWFENDPSRRAKWESNRWYMNQMGGIMKRVKKTGDWNVFWDAIDSNKRLREMWFANKAGRRQEYVANQRYIRFIGDLVQRAKRAGDWDIFWQGLEDNPAMARIYYKSHPGSREGRAQNSAYSRLMGGWVKLLDAKKYQEAQAYFDALPSWAKERYRKNHPQSAKDSAYIAAMKRWVGYFERNDSDGAMRYFNSLPEWMRERYYAKHPGKRDTFDRNSAYSRAMKGWIDLLEKNDHEGARAYFNALPTAIKERYWKAHPDKRDFTVDQDMFAKLSQMFMLLPEDQGDFLAANPDLRAWMAKRSGGREEVRRAMILQVYRSIPAGQSWLKGVIRDRYPEIFSAEATAARQDAKTAAQLAEHPELAPGYAKYLDLIVSTYLGSVAYSSRPPKQLTKVQREAWDATRKKRLRKRREWQIAKPRSAVPGLANVQEFLT